MALRRGKGQDRNGGGVILPTRPADPTAGLIEDPQPGVDVEPGQQATAAVAAPLVPMEQVHAPLGEILVSQGAITQQQLIDALAAQPLSDPHRRIGELLVHTQRVPDRAIGVALAAQSGLAFVDLANETPEGALASLLPEELVRELAVAPVRRAPQGVYIAVADPTIPDLRTTLATAAGDSVQLVCAGLSDVVRFQNRLFSAVAEVDKFVKAFEARSGPVLAEAATERVDENAPVVQVVSRLLSQAVRDRASDVHIEPMGDRVRVRNRIDGALHEVLSLPQSMSQALVSRIKIMASLNIVERRRPQDGQLEVTVDGRELDVRVSTTGTVFGEKTVMRILDKQRALYDLGELGMPPGTAAVYRDVIASPYGMVVCAGPTGSGKTTTLYATMSEIQSEEINVMTVEDPVEYVFPTINQISINEQAGITFAGGLRAILRQDPDAILVGEIRDVETARIAIQAALTGHFVMSTIHATDSTSALHRFLDMGIESFLLASAMLAVVGQRLVRRNCDHCLETYELTPEDHAFYLRAGGQKPEGPFQRGRGCSFCSDTGYFGRVGVYEVLRITDEMRELMVQNAAIEDMRKLGISQGMVPMRDQAVGLIDVGVTTVAEVMRTVYVV